MRETHLRLVWNSSRPQPHLFNNGKDRLGQAKHNNPRQIDFVRVSTPLAEDCFQCCSVTLFCRISRSMNIHPLHPLSSDGQLMILLAVHQTFPRCKSKFPLTSTSLQFLGKSSDPVLHSIQPLQISLLAFLPVRVDPWLGVTTVHINHP